MKARTDFEITDGGSVVTIKPLTARARLWLSEACEIAGREYEGGPLVCERDLGQDLAGSIENAYMTMQIV